MDFKNKRPTSTTAAIVQEKIQQVAGVDCVELLKQRLLREKLTTVNDPELRGWLMRAADESAAVAWMTPYPILVLPELIEERARVVEVHVKRQRRIRDRNRPQRTLAA